ncbi:hypothetical protein PsorP6_016895 [Peronosclerospora sorghi]|uniref:Uncharacterized protein n=1 Tax=Peronosclerospora sorghi TaxID=230839 RepID=A0ACC0WDJ8_9STRA|nr:hypothetical protein PsorP6_016895 [Peronosclerospora sorghi]
MVLSLTCVLVGSGEVFGVKIDECARVWELKDAIKDKNKVTITCDAKDLEVFLARTENVRGSRQIHMM